MSLAGIQARLTEVLGIDPTALGRSAVDGAVHRRMREMDLTTLEAYVDRLRRDPAEFDDLASALLVHETSFFRYPASFGLLARAARERLQAVPGTTFRVRCVACATGEEPASAVMALLEAGVQPERMRVDAGDVSASALARAREGRYPAKALRTVPPALRERYFDAAGDDRVLSRRIREAIHYRRENAIDDAFGAEDRGYDAVFCRNLFIYLVPEARLRVLDAVLALLRPSGLLFVGHAEVAAVRERGLQTATPAEAFALRKVPLVTRPRRHIDVVLPSAVDGEPPDEPESGGDTDSGTTADPLAHARRLADEGRLEEARRLLDPVIDEGVAAADHYHLLGVIESACSRGAASEEALVKALYLDPAHYPSLLQLALLMEGRGEALRAGRLRSKAARVHATWRERNGGVYNEETSRGEA